MSKDSSLSFEVLGARQSLVSKAQAAKDAVRNLNRAGSASSSRSQHSPLYMLDSGSTASIRADAASPCDAITPVLRVTSVRSPGSGQGHGSPKSPSSLEATSVFSNRNSHKQQRPSSAPVVQASQAAAALGVSRIHQAHLTHQPHASVQGQQGLAPASQAAASLGTQAQHRSSASSKERPMSPLHRAASNREAQGTNSAGRAWSSSGARPLSAGMQMRRSVSLGSGLRGLKVDSAGWIVGPGGKLTGISVGGRSGSENGLYQQQENTRSDDLLASMFQHLELNNAARGTAGDQQRLSTLVMGNGNRAQPTRLSLDGLGGLSDGASASPSMAAGTPTGMYVGSSSSPGAASGATSGPPSSLASSPGANGPVHPGDHLSKLAPSTHSPKSPLGQKPVTTAAVATGSAGLSQVSVQGSKLGMQPSSTAAQRVVGPAPNADQLTVAVAPPSAPLITDRSPRVIGTLSSAATQGTSGTGGAGQPAALSSQQQPSCSSGTKDTAASKAAESGSASKSGPSGTGATTSQPPCISDPSSIKPATSATATPNTEGQVARQAHHLAMTSQPDADDWDVSGILKGRNRTRGVANGSLQSPRGEDITSGQSQATSTMIWGFNVEPGTQTALQSSGDSGELSQDGSSCSNSGPLKKTSHLTLDMSKIKNPYADSVPTQVNPINKQVSALAAASGGIGSPSRVTSSPKALALDSTAAPAAISAQALLRLDSPGGRGPMSPLHPGSRGRGHHGKSGASGLGRVVTAVGVLKPPLTPAELQFLKDKVPGAKQLPHRSCEPFHELLESISQLSDAFGLDVSVQELVAGFCVHRHTLE